MAKQKQKRKRRTPEARRVKSKAQIFESYLKRLEQLKAYVTHPTPPPQWFQKAFREVRESFFRWPATSGTGHIEVTTLDLVDWSVTIRPDAANIELARAFEMYLLPFPEEIAEAKRTLGACAVDFAVSAYAENMTKCLNRAPDLFYDVLMHKLKDLTIEAAQEVALIVLRELSDELLPPIHFDFNRAVEVHEQVVSDLLKDRIGVPLPGRPAKTRAQIEREAREKEAELQAIGAAIDQIIEEWPRKSSATMTGEILCRVLGRKGYPMGQRTLTRRLGELGMTMDDIRRRIEKSRAT